LQNSESGRVGDVQDVSLARHKRRLLLFLRALFVISGEALRNRYGLIETRRKRHLLLFLRALFVISGEALRNRCQMD
jgi:hypothetical protein